MDAIALQNVYLALSSSSVYSFNKCHIREEARLTGIASFVVLQLLVIERKEADVVLIFSIIW